MSPSDSCGWTCSGPAVSRPGPGRTDRDRRRPRSAAAPAVAGAARSGRSSRSAGRRGRSRSRSSRLRRDQAVEGRPPPSADGCCRRARPGRSTPPAWRDLVDEVLGSATGTAKPTPALAPDVEAMALLMPMTLASPSISGPPELPGLIGASVWMRPVSMPTGESISRSRPLTMPEVTVWEMPKGLPMATTGSPTSTVSSGARSAAGRSWSARRRPRRGRARAAGRRPGPAARCRRPASPSAPRRRRPRGGR